VWRICRYRFGGDFAQAGQDLFARVGVEGLKDFVGAGARQIAEFPLERAVVRQDVEGCAAFDRRGLHRRVRRLEAA
jgi:hypothetical protein